MSSLIVHGRYLVVLLWAGIVWATVSQLPPIGGEHLPGMGSLIADDTEAVRAEQRQQRHFDVPLLARTVIVQRDPDGLSPEVQARVVERALAVTRSEDPPGRLDEIAFALPLSNSAALFPRAREADTTALTYLFFSPETSLSARDQASDDYAGLMEPQDAFVGATGAAAAQHEQGNLILEALPLVTGGAALLAIVVFAFAFRAVLVPVIVLGSAGIAFVVSDRLAAGAGRALGLSMPEELRPVLVALILGVITDYAVFQLSGMRNRLGEGKPPLEAAKRAVREAGPIILAAGTIVALGALTLLIGRLDFFRAFGPGIAITVAVTVLVGATLVPALMAVFGRATFWPGGTPRPSEPGDDPGRLARASVSRPGAFAAALIAVVLLALGASGLRHLDLGFTLISSLPQDAEAARAETAAKEGFADGVVAPTVLMLEAPALEDARPRLAELERRLAEQPGVVGVVGPAADPEPIDADIFVARDAARYVVVFDEEPLGAPAIEELEQLDDALPDVLASVGLDDVRTSFSGDTAVASATIEQVREDLLQVGAAALLVNIVLLAVFLRSLVAPFYLVAASALSLAASIGLTVYVFQDLLGFSELTYYVPFAVAVLSLSLGSDYNLFLAGRVWQEARRRPLRQAIMFTVPRVRWAIAIAGITLAGSFALLALVPLRAFHEFAFAMAVGVLIDTFVVRPLLVPSLIVLFGRFGMWPSSARKRAAEDPAARDEDAAAAPREHADAAGAQARGGG